MTQRKQAVSQMPPLPPKKIYWMVQQQVMIYRIKRRTQIEKNQDWNVVRITTSQNIV